MENQGNELVIQMLEEALEKARYNRAQSAVLMTVKPNGIDLTAKFVNKEDLRAAIVECDELKTFLNEYLKAEQSKGTEPLPL